MTSSEYETLYTVKLHCVRESAEYLGCQFHIEEGYSCLLTYGLNDTDAIPDKTLLCKYTRRQFWMTFNALVKTVYAITK